MLLLFAQTLNKTSPILGIQYGNARLVVSQKVFSKCQSISNYLFFIIPVGANVPNPENQGGAALAILFDLLLSVMLYLLLFELWEI